MIYTAGAPVAVPSMDLLTLLFDSEHSRARDDTALHAEAADPRHVVTKARARALVQQVAHFVRHAFGVGAARAGADVVAAVSTGQSALPSLLLGVVAAGGVVAPASPAATAGELARQLAAAGAVLLVCSADRAPVALAAAAAAGLPPRRVLVLRSRPAVALASADGAVRCGFDAALPWTPVTDPDELARRPACVLFSSGSTGLPKGVLVSHANLVAQAVASAAVSRPLADARPGFVPRTLAHLPTAHIAGLLGYVVLPALEGALVYWMPAFDHAAFVRLVPELAISYFFTVPHVYAGLVRDAAVTDQLARVRVASTDAAPMSRALQQAASAKLAPDAAVVQVWGLTETTGAVTRRLPDRATPPGSLGCLMPNVSMRLVDDAGRDVAPGQPGEALLRGPTVTRGYLDDDAATADAFTADGWFRTGDVLRVDNGLLYLVDRKGSRGARVVEPADRAQELIKYKGLQVAPAELEGVLLAHPAVADAAVVGVARHGTEVPRALVVRAAASRVSESDLAAFVRARVAAYKQLRGGVVFVDCIPRNPSGKILRHELRNMAQAKL